jgi:lipopolysaccharide exporter
VPITAGAAPVLAVLAVYALIYCATYHAGDVFKATNRPSLLTAISAGKLAFMVGPVWWAAGHSIVAVAFVLVVAGLLAVFANLLVVRSVVGVPLRSQAATALRPLPAGACMGAVMIGVSYAMGPLPSPAVLAVITVAGFITYVLALRLTAPELARAGLNAFAAIVQRRKVKLDTGIASPTAQRGDSQSIAESDGNSAGPRSKRSISKRH